MGSMAMGLRVSDWIQPGLLVVAVAGGIRYIQMDMVIDSDVQ